MRHKSYDDSLTPGDTNHAILDIGTDFMNGDNKLKNCENYYIHKQITDTIENIIANHITTLKLHTNKEELKTNLLAIKSEVKSKLDTTNKCDKHVMDYYFKKNDKDIMKSRVKNALFGKSTPTPKNIFSFFHKMTRRKSTPSITKSQISSHKWTPSKKVGGKTQKHRRHKTH